MSRAGELRAVLLLVAAVAMFGVMDGIGKVLAVDQSVVQVVWARYAFAVPVVIAVAAPAGWSRVLRTARPAMQIGRALLPVLASAAVIAGLQRMPLADFTAISFASPLLVVALSAVMLGEKPSAGRWIGVVCGFLGVLVIARPGGGTLATAAIFPLATATFFALYQVLTRVVSRDAAPAVTLVFTVAVGLLTTSLALPFDWRPVAGSDWLLFCLSGILFGLGQFLLIRAFALAPAATLAPFTYVQIVAAILFGVLVFGDVPDTWTVAGTTIIVLAGLFVLRGGRPPLPAAGRRPGPF